MPRLRRTRGVLFACRAVDPFLATRFFLAATFLLFLARNLFFDTILDSSFERNNEGNDTSVSDCLKPNIL